MAEFDPPAEAYPDRPVPAEVMSYPINRDGTVQLTEHFTEPGQEINWADHPNTDVDNPATGGRRLALISDAAHNNYLLSDNKLYDLTASEKSGSIVSAEFTADTVMPNVQIDRAAKFTSGHRVSSVLIATEQVHELDGRAIDSTPGGRSPFAEAVRMLRNIQSGPRTRAAGPHQLRVTASGRIPYARTVEKDPFKGGAVRKSSEVIEFEQGRIEDSKGNRLAEPEIVDAPEFLHNVNSGREISPRQPVPPGWQYERRRIAELRHNAGEVGIVMLDGILRVPGVSYFRRRALERQARHQREWQEEQDEAAAAKGRGENWLPRMPRKL